MRASNNRAHPGPTPAVVYGDEDTVTNRDSEVAEAAQAYELVLVGWFHDLEGLRDVTSPTEAPGFVSALAACFQHRALLFIPLPVDVPGEQKWRLIAHFLQTRDIALQLGAARYEWDDSQDPVDLALRWELDAAHQLGVSVSTSAGISHLFDFLGAAGS